jgi:hypothetical protein
MPNRQPAFRVLASIVIAVGCTDARPPLSTPSDQPSDQPHTAAIVEAEPTAETMSPNSAAARPLHAGRIVISEAADPSWAEGPVLFVEANRYHEKWQIERLVNDDLPPDLLRYSGMSVDLYGPSGRVCTVVVETLTLEAHVAMEDVGGHKAEPDADTLWKALSGPTSQTVLLVGSFAKNPRCVRALWARDASLPTPVVLVPGDANEHNGLLAAEHRRVLASEPGKAVVSKFADHPANPDYAEDAVPLSTFSEGQRAVWVDEHGAPQVLSINLGNHDYSPCRYQGPVYGVVRSIAGEGEDLFEKPAMYAPPPVAVFDADLDGRWELLLVRDNGEFEIVHLDSENQVLQTNIELPDGSWVWC